MQNKIHSYVIKILTVFSVSVVLYGCGVWADFTTYFNLYYNASNAFNNAEKEINAQKRDLFSTKPLILPQNANSELKKVIAKCSQVLQFHSNSGFVEDALFMLGKSFFYQANYLNALRKFNELLSTQPNRTLTLKANLWIGKTQMRIRQYDKGLATLKDVRKEAIKNNDEDIARESFIEEIKYNILQQNYLGAINLCTEFLTVSKNSEINAEVSYEMGKLYELVQDEKNAISSFEKVSNYSPTFEVQFEAEVALGKALREDNQNQKALDIFDKLKSQQKYADSLSVVDLQRGITLYKMNKLKDAIDQLKYVDTAYVRTPSGGIASYVLAGIFLNNYYNFDSASTYYTKVIKSTAPLYYINQAKDQIDLLKKHDQMMDEVAKWKKQILYTVDTTAFIKDSLAYVDSMRVREQKMKDENLREQLAFNYKGNENRIDTLTAAENDLFKNKLYSLLAKSIFTNTDKDSLKDILDTLKTKGTLTTSARDSLKNKLVLLQEKGSLTIAEKDSYNKILDSVRYNYYNEANINNPNQEYLTNNNSAQNRNNEKKLNDRFRIGRRPGENKNEAQAKKLPPLIPPKRPTLPLDTLNKRLVNSEFELGNLLFTEFNMPDSAYYYYNDILSNYPGTPFQAQVLYAMGSYYLTENDSLKADSLFEIIYNNYKKESIVNAAANKLNKPLIDFNYDPARPLYDSAEALLMKDNYDSSLVRFYNIYKTHKKSPLAAKALYATGWILANKLNKRDSAAVIYDSLTTEFPRTVYATSVLPELQYFKNEQAKLKKEQEDSLKLMSAKTDSLSSDSLGTGKKIINAPGKLALKNDANTSENLNNSAKAKTEEKQNGLNNKLPQQNNTANPDTLIRIRPKVQQQ